jgi:hypothetical protein
MIDLQEFYAALFQPSDGLIEFRALPSSIANLYSRATWEKCGDLLTRIARKMFISRLRFGRIRQAAALNIAPQFPLHSVLNFAEWQ